MLPHMAPAAELGVAMNNNKKPLTLKLVSKPLENKLVLYFRV